MKPRLHQDEIQMQFRCDLDAMLKQCRCNIDVILDANLDQTQMKPR